MGKLNMNAAEYKKACIAAKLLNEQRPCFLDSKAKEMATVANDGNLIISQHADFEPSRALEFAAWIKRMYGPKITTRDS